METTLQKDAIEAFESEAAPQTAGSAGAPSPAENEPQAVEATEQTAEAPAAEQDQQPRKRHRRTKAEMAAARAAEAAAAAAPDDYEDDVDEDDTSTWHIYRQLAAMQNEIRCPKSRINDDKADDTFRYRSLDDIRAAVAPLLARYCCALVISNVIRQIGERYYDIAVASLINARGERIDVEQPAYAEDSVKSMPRPQSTGATNTYAAKYAAASLFNLSDGTPDIDAPRNTRAVEAAMGETPQGEQKPAEKPILKPGAKGWMEEVFRLTHFEGTRTEFVNDVLSRCEADEAALAVLLSYRQVPFFGE